MHERTVQGWGKRNELVAGRVAAQVLGGSHHSIDPGGGPRQLHDFEVHTPDERTAAFEVTVHSDPQATAALSEIQKRDWTASELSNEWHVALTGAPRINQLQAQLPGLLLRLERHGVDHWLVASGSPRPTDHEDVAALWELGVRQAYSQPLDDGEPGHIVVGDSAVVGSVSSQCLVEIVQRLCGLEDNRTKLANADTDQRYLFVWVDNRSAEAAAALSFGMLPEVAPELPHGVDGAWIALAVDPAPLWRYTRDHGWEILGSFSLALTPEPAEGVETVNP